MLVWIYIHGKNENIRIWESLCRMFIPRCWLWRKKKMYRGAGVEREAVVFYSSEKQKPRPGNNLVSTLFLSACASLLLFLCVHVCLCLSFYNIIMGLRLSGMVAVDADGCDGFTNCTSLAFLEQRALPPSPPRFALLASVLLGYVHLPRLTSCFYSFERISELLMLLIWFIVSLFKTLIDSILIFYLLTRPVKYCAPCSIIYENA